MRHPPSHAALDDDPRVRTEQVDRAVPVDHGLHQSNDVGFPRDVRRHRPPARLRRHRFRARSVTQASRPAGRAFIPPTTPPAPPGAATLGQGGPPTPAPPPSPPPFFPLSLRAVAPPPPGSWFPR